MTDNTNPQENAVTAQSEPAQLYKEVEGVKIPEFLQRDELATNSYANGYIDSLSTMQVPGPNIEQIRYSRQAIASGDDRAIFLDLCYKAGRKDAKTEYLGCKIPVLNEPPRQNLPGSVGPLSKVLRLTEILGRLDRGTMRREVAEYQ